MKVLFIAFGLISIASCSKKEQARSFKNVNFTIETTVLKDGKTFRVFHNPLLNQ